MHYIKVQTRQYLRCPEDTIKIEFFPGLGGSAPCVFLQEMNFYKIKGS